MVQKKMKNPQTKDAGRIRFQVGLSGLFTALLFMLVGMVWAFILGVLVGKGYRPENAVPEIARLMPNTVVQNQTDGQEVLRPEDLEYFDALRKGSSAKKAPVRKSETPAEEKKESRPAVQDATVDVLPEPKKRVLPPVVEKQPAQVRDQAQPKTDQDDDNDPTMYQYVYQVASFQDMASAGSFTRKVEAEAIKASISETKINGKTWYRVLVYFRGTPRQTRDLKSKLAQLGVDKPLMKSKIPL